MTTLLVDQLASMALDISDRAYVLEQGEIVSHGTGEEIRRDNALAAAYLGKVDT